MKTLVDAQKPAGYHSVAWDGKDEHGNKVAAGVYLYRMSATSKDNNNGGSAAGGQAGDYQAVKKLTVIR